MNMFFSVAKGMRRLVQISFMLLLVACNLPSAAPSEPGPSTAEPIPVTVENATSVPEIPPPLDLIEYYDQKVQSGEWTEGEGLVFFLKAAVGEEPLEIPESIKEYELNGLIVTATQYLQTGTDEAAKAEIQRLLGLLFPSQEKLDAYSVPENELGRTNSKFAVIPEQAADCASFWRDGLVPDTTTYPCFLWGEESVAGISQRVYFPVDWRGDSSKYPYYEAAREAMRQAANTYSPLGAMPRVHLVFAYDLNWGAPDGPLTGYMGTNFFAAGEPCGIVVFPPALRIEMGTFKQALAHEMFHCFTVQNIFQHRPVNYLTNMWWVEGGADYFSNVVYPDVDAEYRYIQDTNEFSLTTPLYKLGYRNFLFFQHMGNQNGDDKIIEMMKSMPLEGSYDDQLAAIIAYPGMIDLYESYARAFLANQIADTSGIIYPYTPVFAQTTTFNGSQSGSLPYKPFVLYREKFVYEPGQQFTFTTTTSRDQVRIGTAPVDFPAWQIPTWIVDTSCNQWEYMTYSIGITANSTAASAAYDVASIELAAGTPCEQCLIGTWKLDPLSYIYYANSLFPPSMGVARAVGYNGEMFVEYDESGKTASTYNDFMVFYKGKFPDPNGGPPIQSNLEISFLSTGTAVTYSASETTITYSGARAKVKAKGSMAIPGEGTFPITIDINRLPGVGLPTSEDYVCKGHFLAVIPKLPPSVPNVPEPIIFTRFLPPSP